jgi:hypothetical protein
LTVAEVRTTPRFEIVSQKRLFDLEDILGATPHANYDISPMGRPS